MVHVYVCWCRKLYSVESCILLQLLSAQRHRPQQRLVVFLGLYPIESCVEWKPCILMVHNYGCRNKRNRVLQVVSYLFFLPSGIVPNRGWLSS